MKKNRYERCCHEKFKIRYHIILATKYRKRLLNPIDETVRESMFEAASFSKEWSIEVMEIDKDKADHIHFLIRATPKARVIDIIHKLKQLSTYNVWKKHNSYMRRLYWSGKHYLWSRGYFCTSIGEISEQILTDYIEKQG